MQKITYKPTILITFFIFIFCKTEKLFGQIDLNAPASFYGYWEGKITFKAFAATQDMNIEIQKGKYPGSIGLIIFHDKANNLKNDTIHSNFENGVIKMEMTAKSVNVENDFCPGFLNLALLDENNLNGSFESEKKGCTAVEYFAVKKEKINTNINQTKEEKIDNENSVTGAGDDLQKNELAAIKNCGAGKVTRNNSKLLTIVPGNGKKIEFKNIISENDDQTRYIFEGCIPEMNMYEISVAGYESSYSLLVNIQTGKQYYLFADYILSPDKKKLVSYLTPYGDEYDETELNIFSFKNGNLVLEYNIKPKIWGVSGAEWVDNNTIKVEAGKNSSKTGEVINLAAKKIIFSGGKWMLK